MPEDIHDPHKELRFKICESIKRGEREIIFVRSRRAGKSQTSDDVKRWYDSADSGVDEDES